MIKSLYSHVIQQRACSPEQYYRNDQHLASVANQILCDRAGTYLFMTLYTDDTFTETSNCE